MMNAVSSPRGRQVNAATNDPSLLLLSQYIESYLCRCFCATLR